jgi:hypothetical protein
VQLRPRPTENRFDEVRDPETPLVTAGVGASALDACVPNNGSPDYAPNHPCTKRPDFARPDVGRPALVGGLLAAFLSVVVLVTGFTDEHAESAGSTPQRPSAPLPLDTTTACALTGR